MLLWPPSSHGALELLVGTWVEPMWAEARRVNGDLGWWRGGTVADVQSLVGVYVAIES